MVTASEGDYKGSPILMLREENDFSLIKLTFGVTKARMILQCIPAIEEFVKKHKKEETKEE